MSARQMRVVEGSARRGGGGPLPLRPRPPAPRHPPFRVDAHASGGLSRRLACDWRGRLTLVVPAPPSHAAPFRKREGPIRSRGAAAADRACLSVAPRPGPWWAGVCTRPHFPEVYGRLLWRAGHSGRAATPSLGAGS